MSDYFEIALIALITGLCTGTSLAIANYFANKILIQNVEKLVTAIKNNTEEKKKN